MSYRLILIGDAGEPEKERSGSVLASLEARAALLKGRTTILFLGDNIYESGLPDKCTKNRNDAERRLNAQIDVVKNSKAKGIFVHGNHDWNKYDKGGQEALKRLQNYVQANLDKDSFEPRNGCPGPVKIDVADIRLIIIDSQWWLHKEEKPKAFCFAGKEIHSEDEVKKQFIYEVTKLIKSANDRHVILAAHHPLDTHGPHGGFFTWQDHLFPLTRLVDLLWIPLPCIGSLYPLGRWYIVKDEQDLTSCEYKKLVQGLEDAMSWAKKQVIFAAGHEHSLQVLQGKDKNNFILVSGSGSPDKVTPLGHDKNTIFAHSQPGFMELDYLTDGRVYLRVIEKDMSKRGYRIAFSYWLSSASP